ncbi:uncharacterized protein LOC127284468 [Leptopilina boulardi]|uniref:uncharacterized protein LOC127284468 n=1 Tax=Leptopilina boulardi TaxID=63433 RepID=UPI0021F56409|nr:uncharacterized protein LOC127284468 [Leptopilina boulardi]
MGILSFVLVSVLALISVQAEDTEHYPIRWVEIDIKPIVDNDRLFKKYTECIISDKMKGCPKEATQIKTAVPEIMETLCKKCLPLHISRGKEYAAYVCQKRPNESLAILKKQDPTGQIRKRFEETFGVVEDCKHIHV